MTTRISLLVLTSLVISISADAQKRTGVLPDAASKQLKDAGFVEEDIADLVVNDDYRTAHNGLHHLFLRQRWQGIEVWNGDIAIHSAANGSLMKLNNGAWSHMAKRVNATEASISASDALRTVLAKNVPGAVMPVLMTSADGGRLLTFDGGALGNEPVTLQLVYQPVDGRLRLAWNVNHYIADGSHWWNVRIDALTGAELDRNDWVVSCGAEAGAFASCAEEHGTPSAPAAPNDYNIYPWPVESPSHGSRAIRNAPWTAGGTASPYGWHDTNGAAGPEFTDTRGNNCYAQDDADANNTGGTRPSGGANLDFDFTLDLTGAPSTYLNVATTNLFYWNNLIHDVWYQYGFDDPSGNFQSNNYGRGGAGNDYVLADAQDGSGTDNANFGTPPDGSSPRMQMYRWTYTTPNRDSDLDNGIIAHEYAHGISNRLVGGPANTSCLGNVEQMGEGWSDWFGLVMTIEPGDQGTDRRGIGTYVIGQSTTGGGIRPSPYSTDFSQNNYTYAGVSTLAVPHGVGFVWCTMLWEMTWELINFYGFDPNIYSGTGGNNIAMRLVIDGMKLTPCNPGFVDARDAILAADLADYGGANQNMIWAAFARRGLGSSASQGSSNSRSDQTVAYDTPLPNNVGVAAVLSPTGSLLDCGGSPLTVSATVRNFGQSAQTGFPMRYQLDGGTIVTQTYTATLAAGASATFTFTQPVVVSGVGAHSLVVSTGLSGDQYVGNDQATSAITLSAASTINAPFTEAIESGATTPTGWSLQNPDGGGTWTTAAVSGQSACVGGRSWAIDFYSVNAVGQEDRLLTPLVSLAASAGTHLKFSHAYSGYSSSYVDGLRVDISSNCGASWSTLYQASGTALQTVAYNTNAFTPSDCSQWVAHDIDISAYDGQTVLFRFVGVNGYGNWLFLDNAQVESNGVKVALKLLLDGAYDTATDRMRDSLRTSAAFPLTEPYTTLGFAPLGGGGGETIQSSVLATTGDNAIVDWVLIELRNSATPATRVSTRCALVQRDGDVVATDGVSPVSFLASPGSYYIAARHRNHLGAMTAAPVTLSGTTFTLDLSSTGTATYGTEARRPINGRMALWSGNVLRDNKLQYTGQGNDRDDVLLLVGGSVPTNTSAPGYFQQDVNLDRLVRYVGQNNDRDPILLGVGGSVPTNSRFEQLP